MFNKQENTEKPKLPLVNINDASIKKLNKQAATQAKKKPEVTEESKSKESLISMITRKIKSFFSWLYKIFLGKCNPSTETINNSQTPIKKDIQCRKNNLIQKINIKSIQIYFIIINHRNITTLLRIYNNLCVYQK